ncbi:helix-turn-helix domain-containing protein [Chengkuizengella axinellae]|uniref:Helix-turn-helix transcriptional regulator n=1 Tax=Chengkuizengella axinellae TaxID=3064388 RepID=A0ABT9IW77_9BACL|nr:helix-turn-helix transcriptional regulator [Chengkuizengella sp. 2205SS18-9]MDP5273588.1 helix-turn-helix transcriptional regulator [Chengkuizengella sp. 2205SS18-9]
MKQIGRQIAQLRKSKKITQMKLADQLGVSFQAVSNWERGETMPDISKLPELAQIFNVSIDEILKHEKGTQLIKNIIEDNTEEYLDQNEVSIEEFSNVAPLIETDKADEVFHTIKGRLTLGDMSSIAPFVNEELIDEYAKREFENNGIDALTAIAPFMSKEVISDCAKKSYHDYGIDSLVSMCPFIDKETMNEIAIDTMSKKEMKELLPILPFVNKQLIKDFVKKGMNH